jgi:hypothetical protein
MDSGMVSLHGRVSRRLPAWDFIETLVLGVTAIRGNGHRGTMLAIEAVAIEFVRAACYL